MTLNKATDRPTTEEYEIFQAPTQLNQCDYHPLIQERIDEEGAAV